jgi:hypothetical protein
VPEEILYEDGQREAPCRRARQAQRVGPRAPLVKVARGEDNACTTNIRPTDSPLQGGVDLIYH